MTRGQDARNEGGISRYLGMKRTTAINAVLLVIIIWGLAGEYLRNREMQKEIAKLEAQAAEMEGKNAALANLGDSASSEAMLEREARLKLNLRKPGEQVVIVRTSGAPDRSVTVQEVGSRPDRASNASKWWRYFFR